MHLSLYNFAPMIHPSALVLGESCTPFICQSVIFSSVLSCMKQVQIYKYKYFTMFVVTIFVVLLGVWRNRFSMYLNKQCRHFEHYMRYNNTDRGKMSLIFYLPFVFWLPVNLPKYCKNEISSQGSWVLTAGWWTCGHRVPPLISSSKNDIILRLYLTH